MVRLQPHLGLSLLDDETVLLDNRTGRYYSLNPTGARMLAILLETGDPDSVVPRMIAEYDVDLEHLTHDWDELYKDFSDRGFFITVH